MARPWLKLDAGYQSDEAVAAVGITAEAIYVRSLAWSKLHDTRGAIPRSALPTLTIGSSHAHRALDALLTHALWLPDGAGYRIPPESWERWQGDTPDVTGRLGGLVKAHNMGRHEVTPVADCIRCSWTNGSRA